MTGLDLLKQQFNGHVAFRERRPGVLQVLAPLFHEDGDMVDIFLDEPVNGAGKVRIGDHGLTLMRLTYTYDLDTENKQRIFNRILSENRIQEQDGRLYIEAEPEDRSPPPEAPPTRRAGPRRPSLRLARAGCRQLCRPSSAPRSGGRER
jgi:hypothetical protein